MREISRNFHTVCAGLSSLVLRKNCAKLTFLLNKLISNRFHLTVLTKPLHFIFYDLKSVSRNFLLIFRLLINHGAEIDALDENDCTPLMFAAMQNHPHCVNELLSHGADFTKSDFNGETALSLAVNGGSKMAQRVLESHVLSVLKGMVSVKDNGQVLAN